MATAVRDKRAAERLQILTQASPARRACAVRARAARRPHIAHARAP